MNQFPKKILFAAFPNLVAVILSVFFLFSGVLSAGAEAGGFVRFIVYVLVQLLWLFPIIAFFAGLDYYRRGYERLGFCIETAGLLVVLADILILINH